MPALVASKGLCEGHTWCFLNPLVMKAKDSIKEGRNDIYEMYTIGAKLALVISPATLKDS